MIKNIYNVYYRKICEAILMNIRFNIGELKGISSSINSDRQNMQQLMGNINSEINKVSSIWSGEGERAFMEDYTKLKSNFSSALQVLSRISQNINMGCDTIERADRNMSRKF